ncbi:nucleotidyl transferase AbiEii/AbiGii toxin family protein [Bradyrhizobium sp. RDT10]
MIPALNIVAWSQTTPWVEQRQVEQDLIISRALVALFSDEFLKAELRFRGGTALNKLHFPKPLRYSEDIDLVRTTAGPIGPVLTRVREVLNPWLGEPQFVQSEIAPKLKYSVEAEDKSNPAPIRLKIEINTRERTACDTPQSLPFKVENTWFTGTADISTFSNEELLSTKLRALLQCHKGRDLIDIAHALDIFEGFDASTTVEVLGKYLAAGGISISRAEAEKRMFTKLNNPNFMADVRPLLSADEAEDFDDDAAKAAFVKVFSKIIRLMPGEAWSKTEKMIEQSGLIDQFE